MVAKTKSDLEKKIKVLTAEVRLLRGEAKSTTAEIEGLGSKAHGLVINAEDGHYNLVSIRFDSITNKAAIDKIDDLGKSLALASTKVKNAVIDSLIEINKRRG
jgi:hypothetical protein